MSQQALTILVSFFFQMFIRNYVDISTPKDEYIPENKISIIACHWSDFEKKLINDYLMFNEQAT